MSAKTFSNTQFKLLLALADGALHSGQNLAVSINVTCAVIGEKIAQLSALGLSITSTAQGYCLQQPLTVLQEEVCRCFLQKQGFNAAIDWHFFASIDSTNKFLKTSKSTVEWSVCCAETQTNGRGRFNRHWHSPFGENIYFSLRTNFNCDLAHLSGLSLVASIAARKALCKTVCDSKMVSVACREAQAIQIKWPNDLYWNNKKLGGCLIEVISESHNSAAAIIGIGLNINSKNNASAPWCSMYDITGHLIDRNQILSNLIIQLQYHLIKFKNAGFSVFKNDWDSVDYLKGKNVTITNPAGNLQGIVIGINNNGLLNVLDEKGIIHALASGDTSLAK